jgi:hypothetical protein
MNNINLPDDIRYMRADRLRSLLEPFGYTVESFGFEGGTKVYVKGNGLPFLFNGLSEDGDNWTAAGHAFTKMMQAGYLSDTIIETVVGSAY